LFLGHYFETGKVGGKLSKARRGGRSGTQKCEVTSEGKKKSEACDLRVKKVPRTSQGRKSGKEVCERGGFLHS
jgi:hypothetical protein